MARPKKQGIDYFPFDVDFLGDIKVRKIMRAHGLKSIPILIYLLSSIYRDEGYYVKWDEDMAFLTADTLGVSEEYVLEVLRKSLKVDFFSQEKFDEYSILTSNGIQKRFRTATERRLNADMISGYCIHKEESEEVNVYNNIDYCIQKHDTTEVNVDDNEQSKVKKSKEKESINNNNMDTLEHVQESDSVAKVPKRVIVEDFEKLWSLYPKKQKKDVAFKAYERAIKKGVTNKEIQDGIVAYCQHIKAKGLSNQFVRQGGTWFNQSGWLDEYDMTTENKIVIGNKVFKKIEMTESEKQALYDKDVAVDEEVIKRLQARLGK